MGDATVSDTNNEKVCLDDAFSKSQNNNIQAPLTAPLFRAQYPEGPFLLIC